MRQKRIDATRPTIAEKVSTANRLPRPFKTELSVWQDRCEDGFPPVREYRITPMPAQTSR
jgi:hypothetical protein